MKKKQDKSSGIKKSLLEWGGIAVVIAVLYFTGLHTQVIGTMQRAMLWTGFFDAKTAAVQTIDGPQLSASDYQFTLVTPKGETVKLKQYKGDVVFLNLWASWCPPCIAEMPTIEKLYTEVSSNENIHFIMLSMNQKHKKANKYMQSKDFSFTHYFPASPLPEIFRSPYLPTTFVISKKGEVVFMHQGLGDYSSPEFKNWLLNLAKK